MLSYHPLYKNGDDFLEKCAPLARQFDHSCYITPGLVDLQVNGVGGIDFSSLSFREASWQPIEQASLLLASHGVTRFLATNISSPPESYSPDRFVSFLSEWNRYPYAQCLGWHLEGPYLNSHLARAHSKEWLRKPFDRGLFREIFATGAIKLVTVAPEIMQGKNMLQLASEYGIATSLGHTSAKESDIQYARSLGCSLVTHLYNGMPAFHHRQSCLIGSILGKRILPFTIIADLVHVDEGALCLAYNAASENLVLASDLVPLAGYHGGSCRFGMKEIYLKEGRSCTENGVLAGSLSFLDQQMAIFMRATGAPYPFVLERATKKPLEIIHDTTVCHEKDVILWHKDRILAVWINGNVCWQSV